MTPGSFFEKKSSFDFWGAHLIVSVSFLINFDFWCLGRIILLRLGRNGAIFIIAEVIARPMSHKQAIFRHFDPQDRPSGWLKVSGSRVSPTIWAQSSLQALPAPCSFIIREGAVILQDHDNMCRQVGLMVAGIA